MLFPQQNLFRNQFDLSGIWAFQVDPERVGESESWHDGLAQSRPIAVPGSWNEQYEAYYHYFDLAWYFKRTFIPASWQGQRVFLRVGSACYYSSVYINGRHIGSHTGGYLPFTVEITQEIFWDSENCIAISVDNELKPDRLPAAGIKNPLMPYETHPLTTFDFFPFSGIHRPVVLFSLPPIFIEDITVNTDIRGTEGIVTVKVKLSQPDSAEGTATLCGFGAQITVGLAFYAGEAEITIEMPNAKLWSDRSPHLYDLTVATQVDCYRLSVGIRTIAVKDGQILLNGEPVKFNGFGRHEDFIASGKGLNLPLLVKDYQLMKWTGANSYRTAHYPYSEEEMQLADQEGFLIIDEIPAVGLEFGSENFTDEINQQCFQQLEALIVRDKNHPSVVMWSVANEPLTITPRLQANSAAYENAVETGQNFLNKLMRNARNLDCSRPITFAAVGGTPLAWYAECDVICLNRYYGWYVYGGDLDAAVNALSQELDSLWEAWNKPIIISEFGAEAAAGMHGHPDLMWTEEYQADLIWRHLALASKKNYVAGMQVWNFADFVTPQSVLRAVGLNQKGVFTRARNPKAVAFKLRDFFKK